jgi:uncharacterized protein YjbJ (UPF0337 family)
MGITDKISGRLKQAAGDLTGDEKLREEGLAEERKGDARREATDAEMRAQKERERADELRREAARLETGRSGGTGTDPDSSRTDGR